MNLGLDNKLINQEHKIWLKKFKHKVKKRVKN